jgi:hypothetical protein
MVLVLIMYMPQKRKLMKERAPTYEEMMAVAEIIKDVPSLDDD